MSRPDVHDDDIDDSMAANPEEARADLGYQVMNERRGKKPAGSGAGRFAIVWLDGEPASTTTTAPKRCARCNEEVTILHAIGDDIRRRFCGKCQAEKNGGRW